MPTSLKDVLQRNFPASQDSWRRPAAQEAAEMLKGTRIRMSSLTKDGVMTLSPTTKAAVQTAHKIAPDLKEIPGVTKVNIKDYQ